MNDMPSAETSPVFAGRDAELAFLESALHVAAGGTAGTVLVGGELRLRSRWGGWNGEPFTASSWRHVSVYERADGL
jgi:hypothetical protein